MARAVGAALNTLGICIHAISDGFTPFMVLTSFAALLNASRTITMRTCVTAGADRRAGSAVGCYG